MGFNSEFVDPAVIVEFIKQNFKDVQVDKSYPEYLDIPRKGELARQFLWVHYNVIKKEVDATGMKE